MTTKDSLGDRMKHNYEDRYRIYLTRRTPVIIRIDGKAFHSFTKGLNRPYDMVLKQSMWETAKDLCENIMGCQLAYIQSDEISNEVCNYFIWRQQDATRNSVEMLGLCYFNHKELHGVSCNKIQDKLMLEKNVNWNDCPTFFKRGVCIRKVVTDEGDSCWEKDMEIPIFTQNRKYIDDLLRTEE